MRQIIEEKIVMKDAHHSYYYVNGHKIPMPDDGVVYVYLSSTGMLKCTEEYDIAGHVKGKFVMTDEIQSIKGKPAIKGVPYDVFGADEISVYVGAKRDEDCRIYLKGNEVSARNNAAKRAALETLRQFYMMLK